MTSLSPQAQAVLDASNLHPCKDSCLILAAALRAVALVPNIDRLRLLAIADELEQVPAISSP
jgi:hypothetical protein